VRKHGYPRLITAAHRTAAGTFFTWTADLERWVLADWYPREATFAATSGGCAPVQLP